MNEKEQEILRKTMRRLEKFRCREPDDEIPKGYLVSVILLIVSGILLVMGFLFSLVEHFAGKDIYSGTGFTITVIGSMFLLYSVIVLDIWAMK